MKALFLDRDGVINVDYGYVCKREEFKFINGIFDLCRYAQSLGYSIFVVTNQSGIGRGYYTEHDFNDLSEWMCGVFQDKGITIEKVYCCPARPDENSPDRKPMPGMILKAAEEFRIDLSSSILIGDKITDIQAGISAGVGFNFLYCRGDSYGFEE